LSTTRGSLRRKRKRLELELELKIRTSTLDLRWRWIYDELVEFGTEEEEVRK